MSVVEMCVEVKLVPVLAEPVGQLWRKLQAEYTRDGFFYMAAPLSSTPLPIYRWVAEHAETFSDWAKVKFVLMYEQVEGVRAPFKYVSLKDPASYERFALKHLIKPIEEKTGVEIEILKPALAGIESFHVPYGMSLGPQQVLDADQVVVIVSGERKRKLVQQLLSYSDFDPEFPISIIYRRQEKQLTTVYLTEDVAGC